jgi:hypothetical protein
MEDLIMKTSVDQPQKNSVINYLFFGIAASIFTLSIFFSFFHEENVNLYKDMSFVVNSRLTKPVPATGITETYPVNLKEMMTESAEVPMAIEPWMSEVPSVTAPAVSLPTTYAEPAIVVEEWMTDINSWTTLPASTTFEEEALALESWMLNTNEWAIMSEVGPYASNEFAEEQLFIEAWMLDLNAWSSVFNDADFQEAPLTVEDWMLSTSDWLATTK